MKRTKSLPLPQMSDRDKLAPHSEVMSKFTPKSKLGVHDQVHAESS